jgi:tetratricopeptide (TPR) repeat protein
MAVSPSPADSAPFPPAPATGAVQKSKKAAPPFLAIAVIALCLIILAAVGILVVYPQINSARHWRKGVDAIERYNLVEAREHLAKCLEVWRSSGETHFLMARTCRRAGDLDAAREYLQKAKRLKWVPEQIQLESYLIQAQTLLVPWVEEKLRASLQDGHPEERFILEALVMGCLQGNLFKKALQWTTVWVEHHPDDWEARYWNGSVFQAGLRYEWAIREFQKALELNAHIPALHFFLAQAYMLNGQYRDALPHFQEYLDSDANNAVALLDLARCQRSEGLTEEARATLEKLFAVHPEDEGGYLLAAQLALEEDNFKAARDWLDKALRLDPDDRLVNQEMATVLRHEATALEHDNLKPEAEAKKKEAQLYEKKNQDLTTAANRIRDIRLELLAGPDNVTLRTEAGTTLMAVGQNDEALHWLISALLVDPNHRPAKDALGICLKKLGDRKLEDLYQPIIRGQGRTSFQNP